MRIKIVITKDIVINAKISKLSYIIVSIPHDSSTIHCSDTHVPEMCRLGSSSTVKKGIPLVCD